MKSKVSENVTQIMFRERTFGNFTHAITHITVYIEDAKYQIYNWRDL